MLITTLTATPDPVEGEEGLDINVSNMDDKIKELDSIKEEQIKENKEWK